MFDFVWRFLGYTLEKDKRRKYVDKKIKEEAEDENRRTAREQYWNNKIREEKTAVETPLPSSPLTPPRPRRKSIVV